MIRVAKLALYCNYFHDYQYPNLDHRILRSYFPKNVLHLTKISTRVKFVCYYGKFKKKKKKEVYFESANGAQRP